MKSVLARFLLVTAVVVGFVGLITPAGATAQSSASISGVVKDSGGGVIPGATVTVKEVGTGRATTVTTGAEGQYTVPALGAGAYDISAALTGFKTAEAKNVRVAPGQPVTMTLTLEIGSLTETVTVSSSAELINTQTATVAPMLNSDQITRMPTPTRNALNAVTFLPGVNTAGINRDSTINGLPEGFVSITLDGVSNNDNFQRNSDSFFASITPRQDAVEAVTVTLAAAGAGVGGAASGAVTMAFQTRSGTSRYTGSAYEYYRNPAFNTNYIFNQFNHQDKNQVKLHTFGARLGGPIPIGGQRNKAFFFAHYEQIRFPNTFTKTRTVYNARAYDGWFRYQFGSEVREVNVLQLAANNGQISQKDTLMNSVLALINNATTKTGTRTAGNDPLFDSYVWQSPAELFEHQPTVRIDYNLNTNNRITGSYAIIKTTRTPDYLNNTEPRFPGAPNQRDYASTRPLFSLSYRSVVTPNVVNELTTGGTAFMGLSGFGSPSGVASTNSPSTFADQGGYALVSPSTTDWHTTNGPSWRAAPTFNIDDTLTVLKNKHSMTFGANILVSDAESSGQQMVPTINIGFNNNFDPAISLFTPANFPGASTTNLSEARALYATLTGRVSSIVSQAALDPVTGKYKELAENTLPGGIRNYGFFAQDTWKVKPNVTITAGVRWDLQTPFAPSTSVMSSVTMASICGQSGMGAGDTYSKCNFLKPGSTGGATPQFDQLKAGTLGYNTDKDNWAPSASIAWRPNVQDGFMRKVLGDPDQATVRAGFSVAYERQGLNAFTGLYGGNPGTTISLTRNENSVPGLVPPGESWPVLLSQTNRLYSQPFNETPVFPIPIRPARADSLNAFAPDIEIARVRNWTIGFARSVSKDTAVEIRYVGNKGDNQWSGLNYNTIRNENLLANGFWNEFGMAMNNLQANNASGVSTRVGSFAYFGAGTGTAPLPIYLAYLNGRSDFTNPAAYTGTTTTWSNSTIAGRLAAPNPNPTGAAGDLDGNATRRTSAANLGYAANFFVLNPQVNQANVTDSGAFSDYHAMQMEMRRRLSHGLSANVNYQYAFKEGGSAFDGFSYGRTNTPTANVRHALKFQTDWTLPWGHGDSKVMNGLTGGWSLNMVARFQTVLQDFGNVKLVGMSKDELQSMYQYYIRPSTTGVNEVWMLPEDVILNTRRAFSTINTTVDGYSASLGAPTGKYIAPANSKDCLQVRPGDCAERSLQLLAPWFKRVDFGATKRIDIGGSRNFEIRFDLLNLFDNPNFTPVANPGSGATIFRTTSAYIDASNTYDPGGRIGTLMFRFTW